MLTMPVAVGSNETVIARLEAHKKSLEEELIHRAQGITLLENMREEIIRRLLIAQSKL